MERTDRKRKASEITESLESMDETYTKLSLALRENDAKLREELRGLRVEFDQLKAKLTDVSGVCHYLQDEVTFLHADAVIDRARTALWHIGDLSLLRKVIDPRTRVLRSTEGRCDRSLYLSDSAPKKSSGKAPVSSSRSSEISPKHESDEAMPEPPLTEPVVNTEKAKAPAQEMEDEYSSVPLLAGKDGQVNTTSELQKTTSSQETTTSVHESTPEKDLATSQQELAEAVLMNCSA
ncbi:Protein kinase [Phytophthora cinnamomi]|uniref:Protein kinase n=1 Tax=Phytophthora cinnamomi TaxID=4785 RepID=UPI00355A7460|nr:Protein kinase [Phytophthora cinnamomi]